MQRPITQKRAIFRPSGGSINIYRLMLWVALILGGVWLLMSMGRGQVEPLFQATPTPTRAAASYIQEAEAYFQAGKLDDPDPAAPAPPRYDAIDTYRRALEVDPQNAQAWARLARIQTYSSSLLSSDEQRQQRLLDARASIETAIGLNPEDSTIYAIYAFVLDWNASSPLVDEAATQELLTLAEAAAVRAIQLDPENALALAYYAEVLLDQQKWSQAEQYIVQAVSRDPASMDGHRVYGTVLESLGQYRSAIEQYLKAAEINPSLTFLYVYIGRNYLRLRLYDRALEYFARAAEINEQINVRNPLPYIEIAKTYSQQGEFFIAARNAEKALSFDPTNPNTYGQLGIIYIRSRNYEDAMPALQCAVRGCTAEENTIANVAVRGLPLTNVGVAYYYVEYGTVMAFLSRPNQNFCNLALPVLAEVRAAYPSDPDLMGIVADSEGICRNLGAASGGEAAPGGEASPGSQAAPAATPTPAGYEG